MSLQSSVYIEKEIKGKIFRLYVPAGVTWLDTLSASYEITDEIQTIVNELQKRMKEKIDESISEIKEPEVIIKENNG